MYSQADPGDPQYNFIDIDTQAGYRVNDQPQQSVPPLASISGPVPFQHPNLNLDAGYTAGYRYISSQTQPEQGPLAVSFSAQSQDSFSLDVQASGRDLYPTGNQLPTSPNDPPVDYQYYPSGDFSVGEGPSTSSQVDPSPYPNIVDAQAGGHRDVQYPASSGSQLPVSSNDPSIPDYQYPSAFQVDPSPYPNVLDTRRGNYTIVTDAENDESIIFSNVSSVQPTPFNSFMGTMFPDPNIGARTNYNDNYSAVGNSAAARVESAPSATPYAASMHHYATMASQFPDFYAPFQSADGVSTMPDPEDVMPLHAGQPLPLDEPLCFDAPSFGNPLPNEEPSGSRPSRKCRQVDPFIAFDPLKKKLRGWTVNTSKDVPDLATSSLSSKPLIASSEESTSQQPGVGPAKYEENHPIHQDIVKKALGGVIDTVVNGCPFLFEDERKQEVHSALTTATHTVADVDSADQWTSDNESMLYRTLSAPSTNIMAITRKHALHLVPRGYDLRLPLESDESEPTHQSLTVKNLIKPSFPPKFIFKAGRSKPFENEVIQDLVQNTIIDLEYQPHVTSLDGMYSTAAVAMYCVLVGMKRGGNDNVEFSVKEFKPMHTRLMDYIKEDIASDKELLEWWENHKLLMQCRLADIYAFCSKLKAKK